MWALDAVQRFGLSCIVRGTCVCVCVCVCVRDGGRTRACTHTHARATTHTRTRWWMQVRAQRNTRTTPIWQPAPVLLIIRRGRTTHAQRLRFILCVARPQFVHDDGVPGIGSTEQQQPRHQRCACARQLSQAKEERTGTGRCTRHQKGREATNCTANTRHEGKVQPALGRCSQHHKKGRYSQH